VQQLSLVGAGSIAGMPKIPLVKILGMAVLSVAASACGGGSSGGSMPPPDMSGTAEGLWNGATGDGRTIA
jgi:hypothetical protein